MNHHTMIIHLTVNFVSSSAFTICFSTRKPCCCRPSSTIGCTSAILFLPNNFPAFPSGAIVANMRVKNVKLKMTLKHTVSVVSTL